MLWKKQAPDPNEILNELHINDRIQLELRGRTYASRVEDIQQMELHVAVPIDGGSLVKVRPGENVGVVIFGASAMKRYTAKVNAFLPYRVPSMSIGGFKASGEVQRRDFVRVPEQLAARFRYQERPGVFGSWKIGATRDISGGGVRILAQGSDIPNRGDFLDVEIKLGEGHIVSAISSVVRVLGQVGMRGEFAVQFVQIHPSERKEIVQHVMKLQAAMRDSVQSNRAKLQ